MYFDTRSKRSKIVNIRSSNSGYHPRWIYLHGPDLEFVRPCRSVTDDTNYYLNSLEKYDVDYLDAFQGYRPLFSHLDLKNNKFLEEHSRKSFLMFCLFCFVFCLLLLFFCFFCFFWLDGSLMGFLPLFYAVAGNSLKQVLHSGVLAKMEKTMMLLVKKSASGAVDRTRTMVPHSNHSVSIELLDDQGNKVVGGVEQHNIVGDGGELVPQKRPRSQVDRTPEAGRGAEGASGSGVNKTLSIINNRGVNAPTAGNRPSKEFISVELRPNERWIGGSTVPLRVF